LRRSANRIRALGTLDEQRNGVMAGEFRGFLGASASGSERRREDMLARDVQRLAAGDEA
jgi:hypothetical protein